MIIRQIVVIASAATLAYANFEVPCPPIEVQPECAIKQTNTCIADEIEHTYVVDNRFRRNVMQQYQTHVHFVPMKGDLDDDILVDNRTVVTDMLRPFFDDHMKKIALQAHYSRFLIAVHRLRCLACMAPCFLVWKDLTNG